MTIGKVTTATFTIDAELREVRAERAWLHEMNGMMDEALKIAKKTEKDIEDLTVKVGVLNKSMDEQLRSNELMERQMSESRNVKLFPENQSENVKLDASKPANIEPISAPLSQTVVGKILSFMRNIWIFFIFKSQE